MNSRIEKLKNILEENQALIIKSHVNRLYFTGFSSSAGTLLVTKDNCCLLVDFRYYEMAKRKINGINIILAKNTSEQIKDLLIKEKVSTILVESEEISVCEYLRMKEVFGEFSLSDSSALSSAAKKLRSIKSPEEIQAIKKAQSVTDRAFSHILNFIKTGITEKEVALELEFFMRKNGGDDIAFDTIAVSGRNSSLPHGVPSDKPLESGDLLTMDFGASWEGYCSDMTRTVAVGFATDAQKQVYDTVLGAQQAAFEKIKPSAVCKDVDKAARDYINNAGYENCFGHGLGHSVGLEIHEFPCFNTSDTDILKPGMVITVEPGIYLENQFGVRIEDMIAVTDNGFENLTHSPKELIIL